MRNSSYPQDILEMLGNVVLLVFAIFNLPPFLKAEEPQVHLPIGSLVGRERTTLTGVNYYSYQGIPYGEPPVGSLRFQGSIEKKPWKDVLDATHERSPCHQMYHEDGAPEESEDCLFINVYTPVKPSTNKSLPVMFWIYGGGFTSGMAVEKQWGADHLVAKDVVVVEANYRLGAFGFFSFGDDVAPGNAGLKDQNLALLWTHKYIEYFGGDPTKVTIFGQSAGGASTSYHLLSPLSKGLFSAAILESGSALMPWAYNRKQSMASHELVKAINETEYTKHSNSSSALLNYVQSLPADAIQDAWLKVGFYGFAPVIEVEHPGAMFTKIQYESFETGAINRVPIMLGFNSEELIGSLTGPFVNQSITGLESDLTQMIPEGMNEKPELRNEIGALIHQHYAPDGSFFQNRRNYATYLSDQGFSRALHKQALLQSKYGNVWFYRFAYKGTLGDGVSKPVHGFSPDVGHSEEIFYIFAFKYTDRNTADMSLYPKEDVLVHNRLVTLWTNFAKYHNPTPVKDEVLQNITWPMFTPTEEGFVDIGSDMEIKNYPKKEDFGFWEKLYEKYGVPPYITY